MNEQFLKRMQGYLQEEYEEYLKTLDEDAYRGPVSYTHLRPVGHVCGCAWIFHRIPPAVYV